MPNSSKKYYWLGLYPLEEESIVLPGNWGRLVSLYRSVGNNYGDVLLYLREEIWEKIRVKEFPNLPSRMTSIFLCENIESARYFRDSNGRFSDILYEIELIDNKPIFKTDWSFVNWPPQPFLLKSLEDMASKYWKAENIQNIEVLTESRIKIIRKVE